MRIPGSALLLAGFPCATFADGINLLEQASEGGVPVVVTLALSILFLAVAIERLRNLRARHVRPPDLVARVDRLWADRQFQEIEKLLAEKDHHSSLARVLACVLEHRHQPYAVVSRLAEEAASMELRRHQQKAYALAIVATVAPIVGLLGTVLGMVEAFHVIAYSEGMGNPALLAGGISKALVNTAAGLIVALPALGMHHYLKHRLAQLSLALEKDVSALINRQFLLPAVSPTQDGAAHAR